LVASPPAEALLAVPLADGDSEEEAPLPPLHAVSAIIADKRNEKTANLVLRILFPPFILSLIKLFYILMKQFMDL
jgi:hypothetical protein